MQKSTIRAVGEIRKAQNTDRVSIETLLQDLSLPIEGVGTHLSNFLVCEIDDILVGAVGLEIYGDNALLRSLAISTEYQGLGYGDKLYQNIIENAKKLQIRNIYLLTEGAENFFAKRGFKNISRARVDTEVKKSPEFTTICPESAICMKLNLI